MKMLARWLAVMALAACFCVWFSAPVLASATPEEGGAEPVSSVPPYEVPNPTTDVPPEVGAEAYVVMDANTGQVLVSKNADLKEYPASITKILTIGLTLEALDDYKAHLNDRVTVSWDASHSLMPGASKISLTEGEIVSLEDLLYAAQIVSANDASNVLAEYTGGTMDQFAWMMTDKAQKLGATGSNFVNASGLPDPNHYTTAMDMARITRWALTVPGFRELFGAYEYTMAETNKQPVQREFSAFNRMVAPNNQFRYPGLIGSKTGYTGDARYTLASAAGRNGMELVCVVLKCDRSDMVYEDSWALLNYCFDNFRSVSFPAAGIPSSSVVVYGGSSKSLGDITVTGGEDSTFLLHNSLNVEDVTVECQVPGEYVIGQPFAPTACFSIPADCAAQAGGPVNTVPLSWTGLEELMEKNTNPTAWEYVTENHPVELWFVVTVVAILAFIVVSRILYVRHRRDKRRRARLAAARAQMSIRIADRPPIRQRTSEQRAPGYPAVRRQPPPRGQHSRTRQTGPVRQAPARQAAPRPQPNVVMYRQSGVEQPRRVGRMR